MTLPATGPVARVLVVDDEEHIRRLVRALLARLKRKYGVQVEEAANAAEAIAKLDASPFHLIISDYNMPGRTGVDLLGECAGRFPKMGRMLVTALEQLDIGVEAINKGRVDAFLRKPWDNEAFLTLVDSLLGERIAPLTGSSGADLGKATMDRVAVQAEIDEIDRTIRQLRVRLGLGGISPEGFARVHNEMRQRRAQLEVALLTHA